MKRLIKKCILNLMSISGFYKLGIRFRKTPVVLFWHGVSENPNAEIEGESFSSELFESQIKYLINNFEIISIDEFYHRYQSNSFTNKEAVITFDDGYKNNLTVAAPILQKYKLPFTIFVSSQNIMTGERFYILIPRLIIIGSNISEVNLPTINFHRTVKTHQERVDCAMELENQIKYLDHNHAKKLARSLIEAIGVDEFSGLKTTYTNSNMLTWEDIKNLQENFNCTIGSHCIDHCICHSGQPEDIISIQIIESKRMIETNTGRSCDFFAYPNGDFTKFSNDIVMKHYKMGFSTIDGNIYNHSTDRACICRLGIPPADINMMKFMLLRNGLRNS